MMNPTQITSTHFSDSETKKAIIKSQTICFKLFEVVDLRL